MDHSSYKFLKISTLCLTSAVLFSLNTMYSSASSIVGDNPVAGVSKVIDESCEAADNAASAEITIKTLESSAAKYDYNNIGIADVDNHLNIRKAPGEDQKIIGKLPKNAGCTILDIDKDGWAKIKSGKVTGYVKSSYLITGEKAVALAKKVGSLIATVNETLNVREKASLLSDVVTTIPVGEDYEVLSVSADWIKIEIDNDKGYIARQYVTLSYDLKKAVYVEELSASNGVSSLRANMVSYAKQFLGNPYVWGGSSLTNGIDCSGFTEAIYRHFGISISGVSRSQAYDGTSISSNNVKPGDLVFYGSGSNISHVAMYIGNGQIIHASNKSDGIKISNMFYRSPIKCVRIIKD